MFLHAGTISWQAVIHQHAQYICVAFLAIVRVNGIYSRAMILGGLTAPDSLCINLFEIT